MSRKGWWQQLQSGQYPKTKLTYGSSNWAIFPILTPQSYPKLPPKTSSQTAPTYPKTSPTTSSQTSLPHKTQFLDPAKKDNQLKPLPPAALKEPTITISKIQKMLNESYAANELQELLSSALNKLREIYKTNKSGFSDKDIGFLKHARDINNSLVLRNKTKEELAQQIIQFRNQYPNSDY
jgi:hypothetical protein